MGKQFFVRSLFLTQDSFQIKSEINCLLSRKARDNPQRTKDKHAHNNHYFSHINKQKTAKGNEGKLDREGE